MPSKAPTLCELCGKPPKKFVTRRKCIRCEKKVCIDCREGGRSHKRGGSGLCNSCLKEGMVPKA